MRNIERFIQSAVDHGVAAADTAPIAPVASQLRRLVGIFSSIAEANTEALKSLRAVEALKATLIANQPGFTLDPASHRWRKNLPGLKQNAPVTPLHGPFNPSPPHASELHEGHVHLSWDPKTAHYDDQHGKGSRMRGQVAQVVYPSGSRQTIAEGIGAHQHGVEYAKRNGLAAAHGDFFSPVDLSKSDPLAEHHTEENLAKQRRT